MFNLKKFVKKNLIIICLVVIIIVLCCGNFRDGFKDAEKNEDTIEFQKDYIKKMINDPRTSSDQKNDLSEFLRQLNKE